MDEIDIEEHDILQNPMIKKIFPDLSVLKQEVIDFEDNVDDEAKQINKPKISCENRSRGLLPTTHKKKFLGSKIKKLTKHTQKNVKIVLQNIGSYLKRTNRFCEICLILFQNRSSLNDHKLTSHPNLLYSTKQNTAIDNINNKVEKSNKYELKFANSSGLGNYEQNLHSLSEKDIKDKPQFNECNLMVKISDLQKSDKINAPEACFHCHMLFSTQKDLIDHLYNILNAKKAQMTLESINNTHNNHFDTPIIKNDEILQNTSNINNDIESDIFGEEAELHNIYSCPICSYYFDNEKFYKGHVIVKHKAFKSFESMQIHKVAFNPHCKFCNLKYFNVLSYNAHLRKSHKIEMLKQVNSLIPTINLQETNCFTNLSLKTLNKAANTTNKNFKCVKMSTQSFKNSEILTQCTDVKVKASKIILFECSECHVHFLTNKVAITHYEHSECKRNWECKNCHKLFKDRDANIHQKQHELSNYFSIKSVHSEIQPKILYKCSHCAVHYCKENAFEHFKICELEQPTSTYCKVCDILIELDIKNSHQNDHIVKNFIPSDFKIISLGNPIVHDDNYKNSCDESEQQVGIVNSTNSLIMNLENPALSNKINKLRKNKKHSNTYAEKHPILLNYCRLCKCNIIKGSKSNVHLKSYCINITKHLCKYCGLTFSNKSKRYHRRLHQKYSSLKLQDFIFYNLHTNKLIKPPMPQFEKCSYCERHCISQIELEDHLCDNNKYLICSICSLRFSITAYKLHMPFHYYNTKYETTIKEIVKVKPPDLNENDRIASLNPKPVTEDVILATYTCKSCNLSLNMYDEVVEHCHLHQDLNKMEVDHIECNTCRLKFATSSYNKHFESHTYYKSKKFVHFFFDVSYFGCTNKKWLKHVYRSVSQDVVDKLIKDSIYKYEARIKMTVVQEGPSFLTVFKCENCQCIIDCDSTYNHVSICRPNSEKSDCSLCQLSFACSITRDTHEKIHSTAEITIKSYKIVIFNRPQDKDINYNISNLKKCYVVYECRNCHVLVEKYNYDRHRCRLDDCKKCSYCGLLIFVSNLDEHISKHKLVSSFKENKIKVVLLGKKEIINNFVPINTLVPTFNGIVCDYTFYKCINCEVCIRGKRNSDLHSCIINAAKSKCPKCDLIFDEGKLKSHLKLHNTDPDCNKETILVEIFGTKKSMKSYTESKLFLHRKKDKPNEIVSRSKNVINSETSISSTKDTIKQMTAILYKCSCGLHYMQHSSLQEHKKKCSGKNKTKQSIQSCSKCGLHFTSEVLFKHLLEHHGDKNVQYKYEIVFSV